MCAPAAVWPQVECEPPSNIQVVVEQYSLSGEGWLRLHLEQARVRGWALLGGCLAPCGMPQLAWPCRGMPRSCPAPLCALCSMSPSSGVRACPFEAPTPPALPAQRRWAAAVASGPSGCAPPPRRATRPPRMPPRRGSRPSGASWPTSTAPPPGSSGGPPAPVHAYCCWAGAQMLGPTADPTAHSKCNRTPPHACLRLPACLPACLLPPACSGVPKPPLDLLIYPDLGPPLLAT